MRFVLPLVAAIVPAVILPHSFLYFDVTPKVCGILFGVAIALILWPGVLPLQSRQSRWFLGLLLASVGSLALSTAFSAQPELSLYGGNWRRFGLIVQVAVLLYSALVFIDARREQSRIRWYLRALVVSGSLIGLYAILQYFGFDPFLPTQAYRSGEGVFTIVRSPGTLGHASYLGTFLAVVVFAAVGLLKTDTQRWWRIVALATIGIGVSGVILSGTRAAMLGLMAGGGVLLLFHRPRVRRWQMAAAAALIVVGAGFYASPLGDRMRARTHWAVDEPLGGARPMLWRDAARMALSRPVIGFGPETFRAEFPQHQSIALARAYPDFEHESPHNIFLDVLSTQGLIGLAVLIGILAWAIQAVWKSASQLAPAIAAALTACVVSQQFTSFTAPTALCFWLLLALLAAVGSGPPADSRSFGGALPIEDAQRPGLRFAWAWRIPAWTFAAFLALTAARLLMYDTALGRMRNALDAGDLSNAAAAYKASDRCRPEGSSADLYYSRSLIALFQRSRDARTKILSWGPAVESAIRATRTSEDRQHAFYNLAAIFASQEDAVNVERSLRSAIAFSPNWFKPHWALAQLLARTGHPMEASESARRSVELNAGKNPEVAGFLEQIQMQSQAQR